MKKTEGATFSSQMKTTKLSARKPVAPKSLPDARREPSKNKPNVPAPPGGACTSRSSYPSLLCCSPSLMGDTVDAATFCAVRMGNLTAQHKPSATWLMEQMLERVRRPGLMAYLNVFEERCQRSALDMMQEAHHWIILPALEDSSLCNAGLHLLSSICSLCHDLMVYHGSYPWKMFGLLVDSSLEQEIMFDCKHMEPRARRQLPS